MSDIDALHTLARTLGVHTGYADGLHRPVSPGPETLVRVCAALGAPLDGPESAADALDAVEARRKAEPLPPVVVAWDGVLPEIPVGLQLGSTGEAVLELEGGGEATLEVGNGVVRAAGPLPPGYHRLTVRTAGVEAGCSVISAPTKAYRRPGPDRSWGVGTHLAALRAERSRSLADLRDLEAVCRWVGKQGGDLVTVLPILPTFNEREDPEPSPYSPVSRLFWSELVLDLGEAHRPAPPTARLDVTRADAEVRRALAGAGLPEGIAPDEELRRYARFRGAQARLGRNWRAWPTDARMGHLGPEDVDADEERFHLVAQLRVREQLAGLRGRLDERGVRLGLDLAVGAHPDGYDTWSRPSLFATGMSVGAPPDPGFPSGQDWGFSPVLPWASRREGHRYLAASIAHQASLSGVLRVDHVMAFTRLYWIPQGMGLHEGTYVDYPAEELFALLTLESHRHRCEVVGENLGTVPPEIGEALPRHRIWGMYLALFEADAPDPGPPTERDVALIGTHDTPTLAGWVAGVDIDERVRCGLLDAEAAPEAREAREAAARRLAEVLDGSLDDLPDLLDRLLDWLGRSDSPLVIPWLEDLWLEGDQVNLPGTRSSERPNWQRPMRRLLDDVLSDPVVESRVRRLAEARRTGADVAEP
ncbi:MAG TPA: 4-alpha-glucanotransferase [Longimicrobiales bacterium]|nr:4-alpha-glucanotransferase [Longimicrobiales bacterium]